MIEVEHLHKIYGTTAAIQDVTFAVEKGEILGFLGPNGAGKTTTMRILTGFLPATSGTAKVAGFDVQSQSMDVRRQIGYLPETPPLYPEMTVTGFLDFVARIKGVAAGDRPTRIQASIQRCGLEDKRDVLIRKLSKGFRQRVGIAQAIVHDPPAIILDEPTVGLDPRQIIEVRNLIKSLAGEHTVILSTHILPEVSMTCSRVAILNRGQIVATNTPDQLMRQLTAGTAYELEVEDTEFEDAIDAVIPVLSNLPGVTAVSSLPVNDSTALTTHRSKLRVELSGEADPGREIAIAVVQAGLGLYEMRRSQASLEDVFLKLTTEETPLDETLLEETAADETVETDAQDTSPSQDMYPSQDLSPTSAVDADQPLESNQEEA
jgi:ABC-2 type transport system ATP-binding protein